MNILTIYVFVRHTRLRSSVAKALATIVRDLFPGTTARLAYLGRSSLAIPGVHGRFSGLGRCALRQAPRSARMGSITQQVPPWRVSRGSGGLGLFRARAICLSSARLLPLGDPSSLSQLGSHPSTALLLLRYGSHRPEYGPGVAPCCRGDQRTSNPCELVSPGLPHLRQAPRAGFVRKVTCGQLFSVHKQRPPGPISILDTVCGGPWLIRRTFCLAASHGT